MARSLAALVCFGAALLGAPARSEAGVIPWMYDAIFGYGHHSGGWGGGYGGGAAYGGYTTGYAPFYTASYGGASYGGGSYGGGNCCGSTTSYAPWTGYASGSYGDGCCSPCGTGGCNPCGAGACGNGCGTSCDPGCGNDCPGGNCGTSSGTSAVPSRPSDQGAGQNPTYAPPTTNDRTPPRDQFGPADQNRGGLGTGSSVPTTGGFGTPAGGPPVEPNANSAPGFAPAEPAAPRPVRRNEDSRHAPRSPLTGGEKIAFKTPAKFSRTSLQPVFELPTIVSAPPRTVPESTGTPTAVASK